MGYSKVKTVRVYVWIGLTIILFFRKDFNFKIKLCDTLNAVRVFLTLVHQTDPVFVMLGLDRVVQVQVIGCCEVQRRAGWIQTYDIT